MSDSLEWIPRSVRDKLDRVAIKLHLKEWALLSLKERQLLIDLPCATELEASAYAEQLEQIVRRHAGHAPARISASAT